MLPVCDDADWDAVGAAPELEGAFEPVGPEPVPPGEWGLALIDIEWLGFAPPPPILETIEGIADETPPPPPLPVPPPEDCEGGFPVVTDTEQSCTVPVVGSIRIVSINKV